MHCSCMHFQSFSGFFLLIAGPSTPASNGAMPGLQDLRGQWSGSCQAYGGGGGATNVDFNLQGSTWSWGDFRLDQAVAKGSCHSEEGVQIEELCLRAGTFG